MSTTITEIINKRLLEMVCKNISIEQESDNAVVARFDCEDLTSFSKSIEGWIQLGIELNDKGPQDYKIIFLRFDPSFFSKAPDATNGKSSPTIN